MRGGDPAAAAAIRPADPARPAQPALVERSDQPTEHWHQGGPGRPIAAQASATCSRAFLDPAVASLLRSPTLTPGAEDSDSTGGVGWLEGGEDRGVELAGPAREVAGR
jgi:hypothetical protein